MDLNGDIQESFIDDNNLEDEKILNGLIEQNI